VRHFGIWNPDVELERTIAIAANFLGPGADLAIESEGAEAPAAIGASKIGARSPNLSQKAFALANMLLMANVLYVDFG
jgi:hypothetical protein